jgi:hypothetical protein
MSEQKRGAIKLTDVQGCTGSAYDTPLQWGTGVTHTVPEWGGVLCRDGVLHCYEAGSLRDALALALLRDPNDAHLGKTARAWVCEGSGRHVRNGIKSGYETLTTVREIPLPQVTTEQRAECAIRCVWECRAGADADWRAWATAWLDGTDRTEAAAMERALAARWTSEAASKAGRATASAVRWASEAVRWASEAAATAAAWAAAWAAAAGAEAEAAAEAATWAAWAAAWAAARAAAAAAAAGWAADEGVGVAAIAGRVLLPEWVDSEEADDGE